MMSRVGSFPPALVRYFLALYSKPGDVVLDPFCGKGTTLLEAAAAERIAVGGDISPDAVISARAKSHHVTTADVANYIQHLPSGTLNIARDVAPSVALFFHSRTLAQLLAVGEKLFEDMESGSNREVATFLCGVLLGLLHGHSRLSLSLPCNQVFAMAPGYVRRYVRAHQLKRPIRDVHKCLLEKALELLPFPNPMSLVYVVESPADHCHKYMRELNFKAKLVITSPPYLNRQTYIKDAWLRLWFLKRNPRDVAKSSLETGNVARFVDGMARVIESMSRSLSRDGRIVMVCGRAGITVDGEFRTVQISNLCLLANSRLSVRWRLEPIRLIIDRKLMKRGAYFAVHHGKTKDSEGSHPNRFGEDEILVFQKH
jgi:site-specific DNA-methyltransferase (adenine-specific)